MWLATSVLRYVRIVAGFATEMLAGAAFVFSPGDGELTAAWAGCARVD